MNQFLRAILFFFVWIIMVIIGQFGMQYIYLFLPQNDIGPILFGNSKDWALLFGAILAFYFFLSLLIVIFFNKYKYYLLSINILILLPALWFFYPDWWFEGTLIVLSVIGWLIGEGILRLYKMLKK